MSDRHYLITLGDLVARPALHLSVIWMPKDGLQTPVGAAHATELVHADDYIRPGDLICSVGVRRDKPGDWAPLVAAVARVGGSGVCFGIGDVHDAVPTALLASCRRHGVPLLAMDQGVPFSLINDFLTEAYAEDRRNSEVRIRNGQLFTLAAQGHVSPVVLRPILAGVASGVRLLRVSAWPINTAAMLARSLPGALIADAADAVYAVTPDEESVLSAADTLGLVCGVAAPATPALLVPAITQAHAALNVALSRGCVTGAGDIVTLEGLLFQQPPSRLAPFVANLIEPLRRSDARHRGNLLETLLAFLDADGRLRECANALFIHPNTVRYRLGRIRALTGQDPLDPYQRTSFRIAVWAVRHGQSSADES